MTEDLRAYLVRRERELRAEIDDIHQQLKPLEAELADVRRARNALVHDLNHDLGIAPTHEPRARGVDEFEAVPEAYSPYQRLTMKQLTVKALQDHFPRGATARQLIQFFRNAWGRDDISRSSFSPQLSRLKRDGVITRRGNVWFITAENEKGPDAIASEPSQSHAGDVAERSIAPDSKSGEPSSTQDTAGSEGSNPSVSAPRFPAQEDSFGRDLLSKSQPQFPSRETG